MSAKTSMSVEGYSLYLYMIPIVATVDFDADDARLLEAGHPDRSTWLLQNSVCVRLEAGPVVPRDVPQTDSAGVRVKECPKASTGGPPCVCGVGGGGGEEQRSE